MRAKFIIRINVNLNKVSPENPVSVLVPFYDHPAQFASILIANATRDLLEISGHNVRSRIIGTSCNKSISLNCGIETRTGTSRRESQSLSSQQIISTITIKSQYKILTMLGSLKRSII